MHNVGFVLISYGVTDALCSYAFGELVKYVGRQPVFFLGALVNAGVIVALYMWVPSPDEES